MKKWYTSKTLWANALAFIAVAIQIVSGKTIFSPEAQIMVLTVINTILRLVTKDKIGIVDDTVATIDKGAGV